MLGMRDNWGQLYFKSMVDVALQQWYAGNKGYLQVLGDRPGMTREKEQWMKKVQA
jgi:hypothetical protein